MSARRTPWSVADDPIVDVEKDALRVRVQALEAAIRDIDEHAAPLGEDTDGFVTTGYVVSVGAMHRALGVLNGAARGACPKCHSTDPFNLWSACIASPDSWHALGVGDET